MVDGEWTKVVNDRLGYQQPTLFYIHIKGNIIYHFPYFGKKKKKAHQFTTIQFTSCKLAIQSTTCKLVTNIKY